MPAQPNQPQHTPQEIFELTKKLIAMGDFHEAAQHAAMLRSHFPEQTPILGIHGVAMAAIGAYGIAIPDLVRTAKDTQEALDTGESENPNRPRIVDQLLRMHCELARAYEALGHTEHTDQSLKDAVDLDPEAPEVVRVRVDILAARGDTASAQTILNEANELGLEELPGALAAASIALAKPDTAHDELHVLAIRLQALANQVGLDASTQSRVLRAAAALFHRAGEYDEAFRSYTRAANFTRGNFDAAVNAQLTNAVLQGWAPEAMRKISQPKTENTNRIFIVGAAHSGSTELAHALTQHPDVANIGPLDALTLAAARKAGARPTPYRPVIPDCTKLRRDQLEGVASIYNRQADGTAKPEGRSVTVDPSILQAHFVGLAALAFPGAKFVFVRREPHANALACFFNGVPGNHPYTKDLATIASSLRDTDRLLDHWHAAFTELGVTGIETSREALAADPAAETRRIAEACGLSPSPTVVGPTFIPHPSDLPEHYTKRLESIESLLPAARV
ncbi:MAG: sulfotransferase [Phycisphaerales bacterium]